MNLASFISINKITIDIDGVEALVQFTRYRSHEQSFVKGLELAEDLITETGITLYTKNTVITPERVSRLIKIQVSKPDINLTFKIKKNAKLVQKFRNEIKKIIEAVFNKRMKIKVYRELLFDIKDEFKSIIDQFLSEDENTMAVYTMLFMYECSQIKRSILFFNQSINVAVFSIAIALSNRYDKIIGKDRDKLVEILKVAIFHNYGAMSVIDKILNAEVENRFQKYLKANRDCYSQLGKMLLGFEAMDSIRLLSEYFTGRIGFVTKDDWISTITNIVLVAESFFREESGLFSAPREPRDVVDRLNIRMMEKKYNKRAVQVLTIGLNLQDIFDFYEELDYLVKECPHNRSGVPYPLEGFKSPTLFVCKDTVTECKYLEGSLKAVTVVIQLGVLKPGKYHRCWLLTPKLIDFYSKHYKEIKKAALEEIKSRKE